MKAMDVILIILFGLNVLFNFVAMISDKDSDVRLVSANAVCGWVCALIWLIVNINLK